MPSDLTVWAAILIIAAITFLSRITGSVLMSKVKVSPRVDRFLDALSVSVIAALVASVLAQNGLREAVAVATAALIMLRFKSAIWAMLTGIIVAATWSFVGG